MTSLLLHNATLIDGTGADPRPGVSVAVEGGRITRVAPTSSSPLPRTGEGAGVRVIDCSGRFLLPGLTDAHVQFAATEADGRVTRPLAAFSLKVQRYIEAALDEGFTTVRDAGGSDLLGAPMSEKARELVLQARVMGAMGAIVAATRTNAELFGMANRIGTVEEGKEADLIVVDGDPLADIGVLADRERVRVVVKGGVVVKDMDA